MKWKMVFANIRNEETDYQEYGYRLLALPMAELRSVMMGEGIVPFRRMIYIQEQICLVAISFPNLV